jgi:hypothetical protein
VFLKMKEQDVKNQILLRKLAGLIFMEFNYLK